MQMDKFHFSMRALTTSLVVTLSVFTQGAFAQKHDSTLFFRSALSVTQNGFSFIPSFSLGKPAAILDMGIGNKRLSFEPQFRFALEGKPWSFIFIYRYKFINRNKFQFTLGGHLPAIVFKTQSVIVNGAANEVIISQRFLAGELTPNYYISKNVWIGMYGLYGHGFQSDATRNTYFAGLRSNFSNIRLTDRLFAKAVPMVFYLRTDDKDGFYATYTLTLAMKNFPLSISNIVNKAIETDVVGKDFDWNVSLTYSFDKNYIRK